MLTVTGIITFPEGAEQHIQQVAGNQTTTISYEIDLSYRVVSSNLPTLAWLHW